MPLPVARLPHRPLITLGMLTTDSRHRPLVKGDKF